MYTRRQPRKPISQWMTFPPIILTEIIIIPTCTQMRLILPFSMIKMAVCGWLTAHGQAVSTFWNLILRPVRLFIRLPPPKMEMSLPIFISVKRLPADMDSPEKVLMLFMIKIPVTIIYICPMDILPQIRGITSVCSVPKIRTALMWMLPEKKLPGEAADITASV